MRAAVARIVELPKPDAEEATALRLIGEHAAPVGMHYLIDDDTQNIIEPAFLYIYSLFGPDGRIEEIDGERKRTPATNRAIAYELAEWLRFMHFTKRRWDKADHELLAVYAHHLSTNISAHSRKRRGKSTISHKLSSVFGFYNFTNAAGLTSIRWDRAAIRARYRAAKKERRLNDDQIRPFSEDELRKLRKHLGPLPSERSTADLRPCRDRLLLEIGIQTGMRGEEIAHLSRRAIRRLRPDMSTPDATQPLRITVTKGRDHRWVALPNSLIREMQIYMENDRGDAVAELLGRGGQDHDILLVNLAGARGSGDPMRTNTIHRRFWRHLVETNMSREGVKIVKGVKQPCIETLHSFHDTRHYYAVNLYQSLRSDNERNPYHPPHREPWRIVQAMLGHADWATTRIYYLRWVGGEWEATASDRTADYLEDA